MTAAGGDALEVRDRIVSATYACISRFGIAKTTVEDVVRESGVSRATIYRTFPGGRDELLRAAVAGEIVRFFAELAARVQGAASLAQLLEEGLTFARRSVAEHDLLRKMLVTEPDRLLPLLSTEAHHTLPFIAAFLHPHLAREALAHRLRPGVEPDAACDYLARSVLSLIASPGRWDLRDPEQVREVVRTELLAGIVEARSADPRGETP